MLWAQSCTPLSQGRSLNLAEPCGHCCLPAQEWEVSHRKYCQRDKEFFSLKKNRKRTHFSGNWNHCPCMLVLTWGLGLWLEVRNVFTQVHQPIFPTITTWWCIYSPLSSEASRGVKSRCMCKEGAEDWGAGVWHGVPCSSVLMQDMHSWHRELCCPPLSMENKTTLRTKKKI